MSYFKASKAHKVTGTTVQCGFSGATVEKPWGVLRGAGATGTIVLETSGSVDVADLIVGEPFSCMPRSVTATAGNIYILQ